jgi:isocitrate lyase
MLAYNCSPSFNWKRKLHNATIADFQRPLAKMGYRFRLIGSRIDPAEGMGADLVRASDTARPALQPIVETAALRASRP